MAIPFVAKMIEAGKFVGTDVLEKAAAAMLDEVHRWAVALAPMRA